MSDRTPFLDLVRQYPEDIADKRVDNINWDILDAWAHTHIHDGNDSALIDLKPLWDAIEELRRLLRELRIDHNNLDIREWLHYWEFLRHTHPVPQQPSPIETHWIETFQNLDQTNVEFTTASVSPQIGLLHLPANYSGVEAYHFVGKPFTLAHTLVANPDPDVQPDKAKARVFRTQRGDVNPFLVIGNGLTPNVANPRLYAGAIAGTSTSINRVDHYVKSRYTFENKISGDPSIPHTGYHQHAKYRPMLDLEDFLSSKKKLRRKIKKGKYRGLEEFSTEEYGRVATSDGRTTNTYPGYMGGEPKYKKKDMKVDPKILFNADEALAWKKDNNTWYWYNESDNEFTEIPSSSIEPLTENNMVRVAANLDPQDESIWVFKTWLVRVDSPNGYFDIMHQLVNWDGETSFEEGPVWKSGRCKRKHWPANVICPNFLEVDNDNIHLITHLTFTELADEGGTVANYYDDNQFQNFDNYQWLPFRKLYGDLHKKRETVTFTHFNPGILATINSCQRNGDWIPSGSSRIVSGGYHPNENPWSAFSDKDIDGFEGANDNKYLGFSGEEIFFYQGFVPYNGDDIHRNKRYEDEDFREKNPDVAWRGIIAHNITTGSNRLVTGNIPFKVNVSGGIEYEMSEAYFLGGIELVKQFYTEDDRIVATEDNLPPANTPIRYAFWADRHLPETVTVDSLSIRDDIVNPIAVDLDSGEATRIITQSDDTSFIDLDARVQNAQMIMHSSGFSLVGGKNIRGRRGKRTRKNDPKTYKIVGWNGALKRNAHARQLFVFELGGDSLTENDTVKIHVKARSEGKTLTNVLESDPRHRDIDVLSWTFPGWDLVGDISNSDLENKFEVSNPTIIDENRLVIMLENARESDRKAKIPSNLFVDYIYVTVEKQGYVYEYEWTNLPDGPQAAVVLECIAGESAGTTTGERTLTLQRRKRRDRSVLLPIEQIEVDSRADLYGIEVDGVDVSIISSKEG